MNGGKENCPGKRTGDSFCPVPWTFLVVATDGTYLSCMVAPSSRSRGLVRNGGDKPLRVGDASPEAFRNSKELKELRRNMLEGKETPAVCSRCMDEESHGLASRRRLERSKERFSRADAAAVTDPDGSVDPARVPLQLLNLRLGNHCSLSCRMCGPAQSTGWYQEWYEQFHRGFRSNEFRLELRRGKEGKVKLEDNRFQWSRSRDFWDRLEPRLHEIREIHFSGGEPLQSPEHFRFLQRLVKEGRSGSIHLDYNTNLTLLPPKILELWSSFSHVSLGVSVDGVDEVNDYIRFPSRFGQIEKNLLLLEQAGDPIRFWITSTLSILNIGRYHELVDWILRSPTLRMNRHKGDPADPRIFSSHILRAPVEFSVHCLPAPAKALVRKRMENYMKSLPDDVNRETVIRLLSSLLSAMEAEDRSDLLPLFLEKNGKMDQYRQQPFSRVDGELWELMMCSKKAHDSPLRI